MTRESSWFVTSSRELLVSSGIIGGEKKLPFFFFLNPFIFIVTALTLIIRLFYQAPFLVWKFVIWVKSNNNGLKLNISSFNNFELVLQCELKL